MSVSGLLILLRKCNLQVKILIGTRWSYLKGRDTKYREVALIVPMNLKYYLYMNRNGGQNKFSLLNKRKKSTLVMRTLDLFERN